jgi:UDP:flavonoid glycosyltransferase YjiC (YdhE family)
MLSEALYLGLPVLAFPQAGQYEQLLNARMLERSGMGMSGTLGTAEADVRDFVSKLDEFPLHEPDPRIRFLFANDAEAAATKLERLIQEQRRRVRPGAAVRRLLNSGEAA